VRLDLNSALFDLWMQCYSQQEISKVVEISQPKVVTLSKKYNDTVLIKSSKTAANFEDGYKPPLTEMKSSL